MNNNEHGLTYSCGQELGDFCGCNGEIIQNINGENVSASIITHEPTHVPTHGPTQGPTHGPTQGPTHVPTHGLIQGPTQGPIPDDIILGLSATTFFIIMAIIIFLVGGGIFFIMNKD